MPDSSTHEKTGRISAAGKLGIIDRRETPSTQHRRLRLLRSSKTGETSGVCLRSQAKLITQSKALRYQIRLRSIPARTSSSLSGENSLESGTESGKDGEVSMKVNVSSPNHFANFFARSFAYSFVMSSSMAISYTPEYQVENLSPVHM